jgi:hypothetical protein
MRLACPTLCALAVTAAWWATPSAHTPATGRIAGSVTLVSLGGAPRHFSRPGLVYELAVWHERIGENVRAIDVTPGATARVTFALPIDVR